MLRVWFDSAFHLLLTNCTAINSTQLFSSLGSSLSLHWAKHVMNLALNHNKLPKKLVKYLLSRCKINLFISDDIDSNCFSAITLILYCIIKTHFYDNREFIERPKNLKFETSNFYVELSRLFCSGINLKTRLHQRTALAVQGGGSTCRHGTIQ